MYRQNDLAIVAIVVLLIMGGSKIWGQVSLSRVSCTLRVDKERVFPGETLSLTATIVNAKLLPVWVHMQWPHSNAFTPLDEEPLSRNGISLLWHQQARYDRHLVARHRGYYPLGPSYIPHTRPGGSPSIQAIESLTPFTDTCSASENENRA